MRTLEKPNLSTMRSSDGYTLTELAICLCIIGILMSGGLLGTSHYFKDEKTELTRHNIEFVMNVLSAYAQTHYRLPCPASPDASPEQAGHEKDDGRCFITGNTANRDTASIVPWKELAIPQNMV